MAVESVCSLRRDIWGDKLYVYRDTARKLTWTAVGLPPNATAVANVTSGTGSWGHQLKHR